MEEKLYVSGMIKRKLESDFCNRNLLKNPRASEINDTIIEYAERMGIVGDPFSSIYNARMGARMDLLLNSPGFLTVTPDANIKMELPTYYGENTIKEETRTYQAFPNFQMKRIIEKKENGQEERIESIMNQDGIELQRISYQNQNAKTETIWERMKHYPQIMVETQKDGTKKYYNLAESDRLEDLDKENAAEIAEEEIATMSKVERIRLAAEKRHTAYGKGIANLLGVFVYKDGSERE